MMDKIPASDAGVPGMLEGAPSRHERRRRQTRQRLIETALRLILEKGYDAITIQEITDRADLGRGTFYLHFKDKEELVWSAFRAMFEALEQEAHRTLDRAHPQVEYFGLLGIFRHADQHRDLYRVMFGGRGSARLTARMQDYMAQAFLEDIQRAPRAAAPPPADASFNLPHAFEAQLLTGLVTRLLYWWLETPTGYTPEQMAAMTYAAVYRQAPPP